MRRNNVRPFSVLLVSVAACSAPSGSNDAGGTETSVVSCRSDRECGSAGLVCDRSLGQCVQCVANNDCIAGNQRCARGQCVAIVPCMTSRQCPGQVCDQVLGQCVDCVADNDCMTTELCREHRCVPRPTPCRSSRECSAAAQVCDLTRMECVDCVVAMDCSAGEQCLQNRCIRASVPEAGPEPSVVDVVRPNDDAVPVDVPTPLDAPSPLDVLVPSDASMDVIDVFTPPVDVFVPPDVSPDVLPDVPAMPDTVIAPDVMLLSPEDGCPGVLLPMGTARMITWSRARMGSDNPTACGSGMAPGAWRDVLYRVELPRGGDLRVSVSGASFPVAFELRNTCADRVMPALCSITRRESNSLTHHSLYYPAGTYYLAVEAREGELPASASISVEYATTPSLWTYTLTQPTDVAFEDVCAIAGAQQRLISMDDRAESFLPPFRVQIFDKATLSTTHQLSVSTNGFLTIYNYGGTFVRSLTETSGSDGILAALSADLLSTERGVCTHVLGTAPQRRLVVQWDRMRRFGGAMTGDITFQAIIHETTEMVPNVIDVVYRSLTDAPPMPVVGLRGSFLDSFAATPPTTAPVVFRFTPRRR